MGKPPFLAKQSKFGILAAAFVLVAGIGFVDYVTGRDLILSILYLAPIALVTWYVGLQAGVVYSVLCALATYVSNYVITPFPISPVSVGNPLFGLLTFLLFTFVLTRLKTSIELQQQAKNDLERRALELDAAISSIADGIIIVGVDGKIQRVNAAVLEMTGLTRAEWLLPPSEQIELLRLKTPGGEPFPEDRLPIRQALHGEQTTNVTMVLYRRDGKILWLVSNAAPIRSVTGQMLGAIASFTDITAHVLQQQQEDFLHLVSHDLRIPLTVIYGHTQLLESSLAEAGITDEHLRENVATIRRSCQRMNAMIQDLVDAARFAGGQLVLNVAPVELAPYLANLLRRVKPSLDVERIKLTIPIDLPPVSADYDRLERILLNLLTNALKYSRANTPILLQAKSTDGEVLISVMDEGVGIAPEELPHLFERFYRGKSERQAEGIGLGLYITKLLVEAHGGRIPGRKRSGQRQHVLFHTANCYLQRLIASIPYRSTHSSSAFEVMRIQEGRDLRLDYLAVREEGDVLTAFDGEQFRAGYPAR